MANPPNEFWTNEQLKDLISYATELNELNETLRAQMVAMNAKLQNEEAKVKLQQRYIQQLELALTNTNNQA